MGETETLADKWNVDGGEQPVVGQTYRVSHTRKGTFHIRVTDFDGIWMNGVVVGNAKARAMCDYNEKYPGDTITIRNCHTRLYPESGAPK